MKLITFPLYEFDDGLKPPKGYPDLTESMPHGELCGVLTGINSGLLAIDVDMKNGKNGVAELAKLGEVPPTCTVRTPSGGFHYYFQHPGDRKYSCTQSKIGNLRAPGLDIRCDYNGYLKGPTCPGYELLNDLDPAPAPEWLLALMRAEPEEKAAKPGRVIPISKEHPDYERRLEMARKYLQVDAEPAIQGQTGSNPTMSAANHLCVRLELPVDVAIGLLQQWYNPRCEPPWSYNDLKHKVEDAAKNEYGLPTGVAPEGWSLGPVRSEIKAIDDQAIIVARKPDPNYIYTFDVGVNESTHDKKGRIDFQKIVNTLCRSEEWSGVWQHNVFSDGLIAVCPPMRLHAETELRDSDFGRVHYWFNHYGFDPSPTNIRNAVVLAAERLPFHPVREYLKGLPEVPPEYLDGFAARVFGCDTAEEDLAIRMMLVSAVRRVFEPGSFQKGSLVLYGEQNAGKSRFCRQLFGNDWFKDGISDLKNKDARQELRGVWGCELSELASTRKADIEVVKQFLSSAVDNYRPSYGIVSRNYPRQCVFIGTTNEREFLNDPTGATRFWPLEVKKAIDFSWERDHVWSAAYQLYLTGFQSWLSKEQEDAYASIRKQHAETDPWEFALRQRLVGRKRISADEAHALIVPDAMHRKMSDKKRIQGTLLRLCGPSVPYHSVRMYMVPSDISVDKNTQN